MVDSPTAEREVAMTGPGDRGTGQASAIQTFLSEAQARLERIEPSDVESAMASGAVVVDIRPVEQRDRDGDFPRAMVVDRSVLEWRLDPTSPDRLPEFDGAADRHIILVCNEGYSSSLAAVTLQSLGLTRATDLAGGFQAWLQHVRPEGEDIT